MQKIMKFIKRTNYVGPYLLNAAPEGNFYKEWLFVCCKLYAIDRISKDKFINLIVDDLYDLLYYVNWYSHHYYDAVDEFIDSFSIKFDDIIRDLEFLKY
jgi:hypothetical protein